MGFDDGSFNMDNSKNGKEIRKNEGREKDIPGM